MSDTEDVCVCPRCKARRDQEIKAALQQVLLQYGKISSEDYELQRKSVALMGRCTLKSFREYRWSGIVEADCGTAFSLRITYSGSCFVCGFSREFKHEEVFIPIE
jgi:hypothetical protein